MPASRKKPTKKTPCSHRPRVTNSKGRCRLRKSCAGKPRSLHKVKNPRKNCKNSRRYKKSRRPPCKSKSKCKPSKKKAKLGKKRKTASSEKIKAAGRARGDAVDAETAAKAAEEAGLIVAVDSEIAANAAAKAAAEARAIEDADPVMGIFKNELGKIYKAAISVSSNSSYNINLPVADLAAVNLVANSSNTTNLEDKAEGAAAVTLINTGLNCAINEPLKKWKLAQESFMEENRMENEVLGKFKALLESYSALHIVVLAQGKM